MFASDAKEESDAEPSEAQVEAHIPCRRTGRRRTGSTD
jgi:hypothetical protein